MAKKKTYNKLSFKDILKGKFLVEDQPYFNWGFIFFIVLLAILAISSAHYTDAKVVQLRDQKEQLDEVKAKYAHMQSKLIEMQLESKLAEQVEQDSLITLEEHPIKIVVK